MISVQAEESNEARIFGQSVFRPAARKHSYAVHYAMAFCVALLAGAVSLALRHALNVTGLAMIYIVGIVFASAKFGRGPAFMTTVVSVALFDVLCIPPYGHFRVHELSYVLTFAVMLLVGFVISGMTVLLKEQSEAAIEREKGTAILYSLSRNLAASHNFRAALKVIEDAISSIAGGKAALFLASDNGNISPVCESAPDSREFAVAQWAFEHSQPAGAGTATLPAASLTYLPMIAPGGAVGVCGLTAFSTMDKNRKALIEAMLNQAALVIERDRLSAEYNRTLLERETERTRSTLLSMFSHDLRTPLAGIAGAASALIEAGGDMQPETRRELLRSIGSECSRMDRLIENLLDITRLESSEIKLNRDWLPLEEIIESAIKSVEPLLSDVELKISLPPSLPLVRVDGNLIESVVANLIENAAKHASASAQKISISAALEPDRVIVEVGDNGPGIPDVERGRIFDRFYRIEKAGNLRGSGLGLSICKAAVEAHGGRIWIEDNPGGGALFKFEIPLTGDAPIPAEAYFQAVEDAVD